MMKLIKITKHIYFRGFDLIFFVGVEQIFIYQRMAFIQINILMNNFYSNYISYTQIGMKHMTPKLVIIFLVIAGSLTLKLSDKNHQAIGASNHAHLLKIANHDPSSTYSLYKSSLDAIRDSIVLTPPSTIATSSITVTTFTSTECKIMSSAEKDQLSIEALLIKNKLDQLQEQLNGLPVNGSNYTTRLDVKNQQSYIQALQDILKSNCSKNVTLSQSSYQTNLNNGGWILGDLTFEDVVKEYSERSMTNKYVTNCPDQKPYYTYLDGCFDCEKENQYFNLETKKCQECQKGTSVNLETRKCQISKITKPSNVSEPSTKPSNLTKPNEVPKNQTKQNNTGANITSPHTSGTSPQENSNKTTGNQTKNQTKNSQTPVNNTGNNTRVGEKTPHPNITTNSTTSPQNQTTKNHSLPTNNTPNATSNSTKPSNVSEPSTKPSNSTTSPHNQTAKNHSQPTNNTPNATSNSTKPSNVSEPSTKPSNLTKPNEVPKNQTKQNNTGANITSPHTSGTSPQENSNKTTGNQTKNQTKNSQTPVNNTGNNTRVGEKTPHPNITTNSTTSPQNQTTKNHSLPTNNTPNATSNSTKPSNVSEPSTKPSNLTKPNEVPKNQTKQNNTGANITSPHTSGTSPQENSNKTTGNQTKNQTKNSQTPVNNTGNNTRVGEKTPHPNITTNSTTSPQNQTTKNHSLPTNNTSPYSNTSLNTSQGNTSKSNLTQPNITKANASTLNSTKPNITYPVNTTNVTNSNKTVTSEHPIQTPNASNPDSYERILVSSSPLPSNSSSDVLCPKLAPFYNGTGCIQCNAPNYLFDLTKKTCTKCPDQFSFNEQTNKCQKINNDFLTPKNSSRLVNSGMPTAYWNYVYDQVKGHNSSVPECPSSKPFYNGKQCINCTGSTQFFNLDTRQCQSCSGNFTYDESQRDCIDNTKSAYSVSASTLKMSSTLFAHQKELLGMMHNKAINPRHQVKISQ